MESRTQGSRPRTQKKSEAKDSLSEDRHSRGQGQECSRPRPRTKDTSASALQKKKKGLHKNFLGDLRKKKKGLHKNFSSELHKKNVFQKIFQALHKILTIQKIVLSSSRGQANFRGLEALRPRPRPRTSKCVLEDVLKAKDVLEDSISVNWGLLRLKAVNHSANSDGLQELKLNYNFWYFLFWFWGCVCKDIQQIQ